MVLELTKEGIKHIPTIMEIVYYYVGLLKKNGIDSWSYEEKRVLNEIQFSILSKSDPQSYVSSLSADMLKFPTKYVMYQPYAIKPFTDKAKQLIESVLSYINHHNSIVMISSKMYEKGHSELAPEVEKYYGIKYGVTHLALMFGPEFNKAKLDHVDLSVLALPHKNNFVPKDLTIIPPLSHSKELMDDKPDKIIDEPGMQFWMKKDDKWGRPRATVSMMLYTPTIMQDCVTYTSIELYVELFNYVMMSELYYASLASSNVRVQVTGEYLSVFVSAYTDTVEIATKLFIDNFCDFAFSEHDYNLVRTEYTKNLKNVQFNPPYMQASDYLRENVHEQFYTFRDKIAALSKITMDSIKGVGHMFDKGCYVKGLIGGNINPSLATRIESLFRPFVDSNASKVIEFVKTKQIQPGNEYIYGQAGFNEHEKDSAIIMFYDIGNIKRGDPENWASVSCLLIMVAKMIEQRFFDQLRTIEQSGYIVRASIMNMGSPSYPLKGMTFMIQSSNIDIKTLRKRIYKFVDEFIDVIKRMDEQEFQGFVTMIINELFKNDDNFSDEFGRYYNELIRGDEMFDRRELYKGILTGLTLDEVVGFYEQYFVSPKTRKVRIAEIYTKE